jgi:hypothetical protein
MTMTPIDALWHTAGLPEEALQHPRLSGNDPALPSSFAVGAAAQARETQKHRNTHRNTETQKQKHRNRNRNTETQGQVPILFG